MAHLQAFLTQSQRFEEHQQGKSPGRAACKDGPIWARRAETQRAPVPSDLYGCVKHHSTQHCIHPCSPRQKWTAWLARRRSETQGSPSRRSYGSSC